MSASRCGNVLMGATFISTEDDMEELMRKIQCGNALNGATFISTLASGNPHK